MVVGAVPEYICRWQQYYSSVTVIFQVSANMLRRCKKAFWCFVFLLFLIFFVRG